MDDDDKNVATPIFKSSTINNIIAAMEPSPSTGLADSAGSSPANPPTPTPEEEEDIGGREVGPWSLGEVLGKGTSGTVRLGAHRATGELVAIKVIAKSRTHITQTASLANLELREAERPSTVHRIPLGVEREVSILKLIRHPNVIQLIDVWANKENLCVFSSVLSVISPIPLGSFFFPTSLLFPASSAPWQLTNSRNRYIITEYVEKGDMFQFINWNGPVREHEAMSFFRQLMDGMQFIHSLNLCHRDLKLENVLVGPEGQVKIADFSMAAVHQFPQHRLQTPCGSPHFAAPEVLKKEPYDGRLADIWSMGIVLFCILGSRLPFDEKSLLLMAEKATKAEYDVPTWFSPEAVDFLSIVLVVDPTQRLSIEEMWGHPLIKNHNDVDDLSEPRESTGGRHENYPPIYESTVDPQLLRQLQAIYHDYAEEEILWKLRQTTANDFKLFYWLLYRHRERQLEKYGTGASNSEEERHLLKPPNWTNRYATCDFRRRVQSGQGSGNRFTLFGNGDGETEDDPFYPMGNPQLSPRKPFRMKPANADFAIHRYKVPRKRTASIKADNASILSSRDGSIRSRGRPIPNPRSRRAINFSHIRNRSATRSTRSGSDTTSLRSSATSGSDAEEESHKEESRKEESREGFSYIQLKPITHDISTIFEEDVVKSGEEVSGFCDRAFFENNSILEAEEARAKQESKPFRLSLNPEPDTNKLFDQSWYYGPPSDPAPYMNRPLPPVPKQMSAKSAEWLSKQKPPPPWAPYGGAYLFPNPPNLKFTIAGASPGTRHTIHDPLASDQSIPGPSVSAPLDDSSPHTAPEAPSAVPEASSAAPEAPLAVPKRRKSAYALFPTIHLHNKPPPPNLPPSAIPQVPNPPTRRSSWFRSSTKKVPDETVKIPRPSLNIPESVLPNPPTAAPAAPIPSIRVVVDSPPPRTPPPALRAQNNPFDMEHPFRRHHPSGLELRPSNIPAPLNIRKISQPAAATGSTEAPTRVPIDIHRKVTLPNPPPVKERAPLAPRRQVSMAETQLRLKDEARAKELEAAKLKRAGAAVGVPAWMKRTSRGDALADDLAEISRVGRARLAAAAAGGSGSAPHETFAVSHGKRPVRSAVGSAGDKRAPTFNFSWPKWLPQPDAGKAGGKMAMRSGKFSPLLLLVYLPGISTPPSPFLSIRTPQPRQKSFCPVEAFNLCPQFQFPPPIPTSPSLPSRTTPSKMLRFPRAPTDLSVRVGCRLPRHRRRRPFAFPPTGFPSILSCRSILPRRRSWNPPLTLFFH